MIYDNLKIFSNSCKICTDKQKEYKHNHRRTVQISAVIAGLNSEWRPPSVTVARNGMFQYGSLRLRNYNLIKTLKRLANGRTGNNYQSAVLSAKRAKENLRIYGKERVNRRENPQMVFSEKACRKLCGGTQEQSTYGRSQSRAGTHGI